VGSTSIASVILTDTDAISGVTGSGSEEGVIEGRLAAMVYEL
jgi:hypothetical protein